MAVFPLEMGQNQVVAHGNKVSAERKQANLALLYPRIFSLSSGPEQCLKVEPFLLLGGNILYTITELQFH
jgi:hypothetical protein